MCNNTNYRAFICYLCRAIQHCQDVHCQGPLSCYWSCVVAGAWLPSPTSGGGLNLLREDDGGRSMAAHLTTPRLPCSNFYLALSLFPCGEHSDLPVRVFLNVPTLKGAVTARYQQKTWKARQEITSPRPSGIEVSRGRNFGHDIHYLFSPWDY